MATHPRLKVPDARRGRPRRIPETDALAAAKLIEWRRCYRTRMLADHEVQELADFHRCSRSTAFAAIAAQREKARCMMEDPDWPRAEDGSHLEPLGPFSVLTRDGRDEFAAPWAFSDLDDPDAHSGSR